MATFLDCSDLSKAEMQSVARELNFSETTFIMSEEEGDGGHDVRIFIPGEELPFAGHPTLGTAFVIHQQLLQGKADRVALNLGVGQIPVEFGRDGVVWMRQRSPETGDDIDAAAIAAAVNLSLEDIDDRWPLQEVSTGLPTIIVPLRSNDGLARARPNLELMREMMRQTRGQTLLLFAPGGQEAGQSLSVRVFPAPWLGIVEDPATGSGNGCLAGYLVKNRYFGAEELSIRVGQGYEMGRPSTLHLRGRRTGDGISVEVGGRVVPVARGVWERS